MCRPFIVKRFIIIEILDTKTVSDGKENFTPTCLGKRDEERWGFKRNLLVYILFM